MRSIFLSPEQVFTKRLEIFESVGVAAPATDLALLTAVDDGFLTDSGCINYYISNESSVNRFGNEGWSSICAVRPVILLDRGDEALLQRVQTDGSLTTAEYGRYPYAILDDSLRDMAQREYRRGALQTTGQKINVAGKPVPVYRFGAKDIICVSLENGGVNGRMLRSEYHAVGFIPFIDVHDIQIRGHDDKIYRKRLRPECQQHRSLFGRQPGCNCV